MERGPRWRYGVPAIDYDELRREVYLDSVFQMREDETYYGYMRRMELVADRAADLVDSARDMWGRSKEPLESRPVRSPVSPIRSHVYQPPYFRYDTPGASSSRRPPTSYRPTVSQRVPMGRGFIYGGHPYTERPVAPSRLGVISGTSLVSSGSEERERSPSPYYSPGMYSPRGYTDFGTDSEEEVLEGGSDGSAGIAGVVESQGDAVAISESQTEVVADESHVGIVSDAEGNPEGAIGLSQSSVEVELEMWMRGTPVEEVIMISSQRGSELEPEVEEPEIHEDTEELGDDQTQIGISSSAGDDVTGDPDFVVDTTQV